MKNLKIFLAVLFALVALIFIVPSCEKEQTEPKSQNSSIEQLEGRFTHDFTVVEPNYNATFTIHVASDDEELVRLFNAQTVHAKWNDIKDAKEKPEEHFEEEDTGQFPENLGDQKEVVIYVSRISLPIESETFSYSIAFSEAMKAKLEEKNAKMVIRLDKTELSSFSRITRYVDCKALRIKGLGTVTTHRNVGTSTTPMHTFPINTSTFKYCEVCYHGHPNRRIKKVTGATAITELSTLNYCN